LVEMINVCVEIGYWSNGSMVYVYSKQKGLNILSI
jgi:hypothetical protein